MNRRNAIAAFCILLCAFFSLEWTDAYNIVVFYVFQARDLFRARQLLAGHPIFFGPEMTGGGNLPGPLYYFLLSIPLAVDPSWVSTFKFLFAMIFAGAALGFWFVRREFSWITGLFWLALFLLTPSTRRFVAIFLNVSYMLPFTVGALVLMGLSFVSSDAKTRTRSFLGACFVIGCGLQFHFSIFVLILALAHLCLRSSKFGLPAFERKTLLVGAGLFLLPSLPFALWWLCAKMGMPFGQPAGYAGSAGLAMPSLLLLMSMVGEIPFQRLFFEGIHHLLEVPPYVLYILPVAVWFTRKAPPTDVAPRIATLRRVFSLAALYGFFPFAYWFFAAIGSRYGQPFYVALTFWTALELHCLLRQPARLKIFNLIAGPLLIGTAIYYWTNPQSTWFPQAMLLPGLALVLVPVLCAHFFFPEFRRLGPAAAVGLALSLGLAFMQNRLVKTGMVKALPNIMTHNSQWQKIWTEIYTRTGWDYETAIRRIYFISHHLEQDPRPGYEAAVASIPQAMGWREPWADGFIVDYLKNPQDFESGGGPLKWVLEQHIQSDLKEALQKGDVVVDNSILSTMTVLPFRVVNSKAMPTQFHDSGEAYIRDSDEIMLDKVKEPEAAVMLSKSRALFKWNECPDQHPFCSTGALVEHRRNGDQLHLKVRVLGQAISQVSPWISPNWTQAWLRPYLEVNCDGRTEKFALLSSIGYMREYANDPTHLLLLGNNSIVAPFEREFALTCNKLEALSLGREGSSVETLYSTKTLPGKRLTLAL